MWSCRARAGAGCWNAAATTTRAATQVLARSTSSATGAVEPSSADSSSPERRNNKGNNWNYNAELSALAVRLGHKIEEVPSLINALRQDSRLKMTTTARTTKQVVVKPNRLSVLGRSTMIHYVNEYLFFSYPMMDGTMLADLVNSISNQAALVKLSNHLGITDLIRTKVDLSLALNANIVSQSFCGVLGAIYQDRGPQSTKKLVHETIITQLSGQDLQEVVKLQHPRFMLNAILSKQKQPKPVSRLINESGRATHFPSFVVGVFSGEKCLGEGVGTSLRRAEQEAMLTALRTHFQKELSSTAFPSDHEEFTTEQELREEIIKEAAVTIK